MSKENRWFGKNCKDQCCQWEETEETGGPDYKESDPCLIFCNHRDAANDYEGNCSLAQCPRVKEAKAIHTGPGVESGKYCAFCGHGIGFWDAPDESPCSCEIHKKKTEDKIFKCPDCDKECIEATHICDVDDVITSLESFRIHLPLHTRDESMPICNLVIGKLWAMDADIDKYKTALENIFREAQLPGYSPLVIANYAGYSLYGDGVQDKVVVPVEVERACDSCLHGTRSRSCRPCIDCLRPRSSWKPRGEAPVPVERNCGTCFHFKENVDSRPCSNCVRMRNHPNWIPKAVEVPVEKECSSCLHEDKSSMTEPCYSCDGRNNWQPKKVVVPVAEECDTCLHENDYWKVAPCSTCSKDGNWQPKKERLTP